MLPGNGSTEIPDEEECPARQQIARVPKGAPSSATRRRPGQTFAAPSQVGFAAAVLPLFPRLHLGSLGRLTPT